LNNIALILDICKRKFWAMLQILFLIHNRTFCFRVVLKHARFVSDITATDNVYCLYVRHTVVIYQKKPDEHEQSLYIILPHISAFYKSHHHAYVIRVYLQK